MSAGPHDPEGSPTSPSAWRLPETDRERALLTRGTFLLHLRPVRVSSRAIRWPHTFGLGGSALVLWCALACTGMLMLLVYQPVPDVAYGSVRTLTEEVGAGALVRGVHYWSANLLVVVTVLHLARVVLTGGYHRPRRLNWILGTVLLGVVLASAFTGYLLPWDQRAYWAVTISTAMLAYVPLVGETLQAVVLGGPEIGAETLLAFYAYHTTFLPVLAIVGMAFHFWRVRKAKGVIEPPAGESGAPVEKVMFLPNLLVREVAQGLVVLAIVVVLGALLGTPAGEAANPGMSPNPAKAAWYFMGFQELLIHLHPVYTVFVLPFLGLVGLVALPWIGDDAGPTGRWFLSRAGARATTFAAVAGVVLTFAAVVLDDTVATASVGGSSWFLRGLLPTVVMVGITAVVGFAARRRWALGRNEVVQTVAVFVFAAFATLTAVGVFLRGEGMALCMPWEA